MLQNISKTEKSYRWSERSHRSWDQITKWESCWEKASTYTRGKWTKTQIFTGKKKMQERGLLKRNCWKAEVGQQLPARWVSAAEWQPKWKYCTELQMQGHHSKNEVQLFLSTQFSRGCTWNTAFGVGESPPENLEQIESIRAAMWATGSLLKQKIRRAKYGWLG